MAKEAREVPPERRGRQCQEEEAKPRDETVGRRSITAMQVGGAQINDNEGEIVGRRKT